MSKSSRSSPKIAVKLTPGVVVNPIHADSVPDADTFTELVVIAVDKRKHTVTVARLNGGGAIHDGIDPAVLEPHAV